MHKDFIAEDKTVKFTTEAGEWHYKPLTGAQDNDRIEEYSYYKEIDGKMMRGTDTGVYNRIQLENIVGVPYNEEQLQEVLGLDEPKEWNELSQEQRNKVLDRLNQRTYAELIKNVNRINSSGDDIKN